MSFNNRQDFCNRPGVAVGVNPQQNNTRPNVPNIVFNKRCYSVAMLSNCVSLGIHITISDNEWYKGYAVVDFSQGNGIEESKVLVVVPFEGKYVVFAGSKTHQKAIAEGKDIKAVLLSKVLVKKAYLQDVN